MNAEAHSPLICPECDDPVPDHPLAAPGPEHRGFVFKWDLDSSQEPTVTCPTCGTKLIGAWVPSPLNA